MLSDSLWGDDLQKGFYYGRHGAARENTLDYDKDSIYAIDVVVPHETPELTVGFFAQFQDGPYSTGQMNRAYGESWGLDHFRVDVLENDLELDEPALKKCWEMLTGNDALDASAARWRLVAAGDAAVDFVERMFTSPESGPLVEKWRNNASDFDRFRVDRILELIGTSKAKELRRSLEKDTTEKSTTDRGSSG